MAGLRRSGVGLCLRLRLLQRFNLCGCSRTFLNGYKTNAGDPGWTPSASMCSTCTELTTVLYSSQEQNIVTGISLSELCELVLELPHHSSLSGSSVAQPVRTWLGSQRVASSGPTRTEECSVDW